MLAGAPPLLATPLTFGEAPTIVVGRTLSAHDVPTVATQNHQLTITYTVYNETSTVMTGVLLTTTLEPGVTVVSSSQQPDTSGQNLAWSLGTVPADYWTSVTLTVSLPNVIPLQIDTGAAAYGTENAMAMAESTAPVTLSATALPAAMMQSTTDANTTDPYIQEQAAVLEYSAQNIFNYLHDDVTYNSYTGSVRGARGTLWSSAGNALDVASLGISLMRASGIPAQYEQGTLSQAQAQTLILSMFPNQYQTVGYIPAGTALSDPANDPTLLAETENHFWFQFNTGSGTQNADPLMPGATIGQAFTASTGNFSVVPQSMEATTEISLTAETYSQASAAFGVGNGISDAVVLDQTFDDVALVGRPVTVGNFVSTSQIPGIIFSSETNTYTPYLEVGDEALPDNMQPDAVTGTPYQEVLTNFPLGSQILTGLFLNVTLSGPGTTSESYSQTLVDRIGYAARQGLAPVNVSANPNGAPIITPFDLTTFNVLPGLQSPAAAQHLIAEAQQDNNAATLANSGEAETLALTVFARAELANFALISDQETANIENQSFVEAYFAAPRVTAFSDQLVTSNGQSTLSFGFNLLRDSIQTVPSPGQNVQASLAFATARGVYDSVLEAQILPASNGSQNLSAVTIIQQSMQQGIPLVNINSGNLAVLQTLNLPAEAIARITTNVQNGLTVIVPAQALVINGKQTTAWFNFNPTTGETIAQGQDGVNQGVIEFTDILAYIGIAFYGSILFLTPPLLNLGLILLGHYAGMAPDLSPGLQHGYRVTLVGTSIALGTAEGFIPYLGPIYSIENALVAFFVLSAGLDPPLPPAEAAPVLPVANVGSNTETTVAPSLTAGQIAGTVQASALAVSGTLAASWASATTSSFLASSLGANTATITGPGGTIVGSGAAALAVATPTEVSISGNDQYSASGEGSLSFYGPAETSLGVSGNWANYSATVTGTVSITLTVTAGELSLNGQSLAAGTYTITTNSATLAGSGQTTSPNFAGSVAVTTTSGTVDLGPGSGSISSGGNPLDPTNGVALDGYTGTIGVSANGNGTDAVTLAGSSANVLTVAGTPNAITTDQNTPVTFQTNINTSLADEYNITVQGPQGWTATIDDTGRVTVTPVPGVQSGTYFIQINAQSTTDPNLEANGWVDVTITPTTAGMTLAVNPDSEITVPFNGAQVPTAFQAVIHNTGPTADTYTLTFPTVPAGFTVVSSVTSVTIPAGQTGIVGIYLLPSGTLPAPGTAESFSVTATSTSNAAITHTVTENFSMPTVSAVTVTDSPMSLSTTPGTSVTTTLTITNVGNVAYDQALSSSLPAGFTAIGPNTPVSLAIGASTTETVAVTPGNSVPLDTTQQVTVTYGPAVTQNVVSVVQVTPTSAFVEADTQVDVSASILAGMTAAQQGSALYTVKNSMGTVVFTSTPVPVTLSVVTGVASIDLGTLDTTGYSPGDYSINVTVRDSSNTPIPGATGTGELEIGGSITATQSLSATTLVPGSGTVTNTLTLAAQALLGQAATDSQASSVVLDGTIAYSIGTQDITILNISNPASPTVVGTFGSGTLNTSGTNVGVLAGNELVVTSANAGGPFNFLIYSLTNPSSPTLVSNTTFDYQFPQQLFVQGTTAYVVTDGIGYTGAGPGTIVTQFGDFLAINFSNPASPSLVGVLTNTLGTPDGGATNEHAAVGVTSQLAYVVGSTSTGGATQTGNGQLQVVNISNPASPTVSTTLAIPGTVQAIGIGIQGNYALVVGTTGGWNSPFDDPSQLQITGNVTLTLLNITNPASPVVVGTTLVTGETTSLGTLQINVTALGGNQFAISNLESSGSAVTLVVDASNPNRLNVTTFSAAGGVSGMATTAGVLYTSTTAGLNIYRSGSITDEPVTVQVEVPTTTGVSIVANSFNLAPTTISSGATFETLTWDLPSLASVPSGGLTWQTNLTAGQALPVTLGTTIAYTAVGVTTTETLPPLVVAGVPTTGTLVIPVQVVAPGAGPAIDAASQATQLGDTALATQLSNLSTALTSLFGTPTSTVFQSQVVVALGTIITLNGADPLLATFNTALASDEAALANATTPSAILAAINNLAAELTSYDGTIADEAAHNFTFSMSPNSAVAQPGAATTFPLVLQNTGTQTTTYDFSLSTLPGGVTGSFGQTSVTLTPGQGIGELGQPQILVTITPPSTEVFPFNFTVTATASTATEITRSADGVFSARTAVVEVGTVTATPAFTTPGTSVDVRAQVLSAVNQAESALVSYTVVAPGGATAFTSTPVSVQLTVAASLQTPDLGSFSTTGFADGDYTINVTVTDSSGTPIPGATGTGSEEIGLPLSATLTVSPQTLPPGTSTVTNTLSLASQISLPSPLTLDGQVQTHGTAGGVALDGSIAYVVGTQDISIVNISNPAAPTVLSTFGSSVLVQDGYSVCTIDGSDLIIGTSLNTNAGAFNLLIYSISTPTAPVLLSNTSEPYEFINELYAVGSTLLVTTHGISYFGGSDIFAQFGTVLSFDISNPASPQLDDVLFTANGTPNAGNTFLGGITSVNSSVAYLGDSTSTGGNTQSGEGVVDIVNTSNLSSLSVSSTLDIPGTILIQQIVVQGNEALVVGTTGGETVSGPAGTLSLTLLDITNPASPTILGTTVTSATVDDTDLDARAIGTNEFVVGGGDVNGTPELLLVNTSTPSNIIVSDTTMPAIVNQMAVSGSLLYTTSSEGLAIYNIGTIAAIPTTVEVQVPNDVTIVPGSYSVTPNQIISGATYQTLVWDVAFAAGDTAATFTWQSTTSALNAGDTEDVTLATTIDFTSNSTPGVITLPPAVVTAVQVLSLNPTTDTVAPGQSASYTLTINNPASTTVTYDLSVAGVSPAWVGQQFPSSPVNVPAGGQTTETLTLTSEATAALGTYGFSVIATALGGGDAAVPGTLILAGAPVEPNPDAHGIVVALTSSTATVGQGTSALYTVQLTNTGSSVQTFSLSVPLPSGVTGTFSLPSVSLQPGASNFQDVTLMLTAAKGTAVSSIPFTVTASATDGTSGSAKGTLNVVGSGVSVALTPSSGPPSSTFQMTVKNTGLATDTFNLSLGGPAAFVSTLGSMSVTLAPGASQVVSINVGAISFATAGSLGLTAIATSRTNANVVASATASVTIAATSGMNANLTPTTEDLAQPSPTSFAINVNNIGNSGDAYTATIIGTSGPVTASLIGLNGQSTQTIPEFRLPALSTGELTLDANLQHTGEGIVTIKITSLSNPYITTTLNAFVGIGGIVTLLDPGFELPAAVNGVPAYHYDPYGSPWTFAGTAGVASNGTPIAAANPPAPQGTQVAFVQGTGSVSQTVNFEPGNYVVTFDAAQEANSRQTIEVLIDGKSVGSFTPSGTAYQLFNSNSFELPTAGSHTVTFMGATPANDIYIGLIDNVMIHDPPAPPAATLGLTSGALTISEAAGTSDSLTVTESGGNYVFTNTAGFTNVVGAGTTQVSPDVVDVVAGDVSASVAIMLGGEVGNALSFSGTGSLAVSGDIMLSGADTVTQSSTFSLAAAGLGIDTSAVAGSASHGTISLLDASNAFATFAAKTDGGALSVAGSGGLTIGAVGSLSGVDTTDSGLSSVGADVVFDVLGSITLANAIDARVLSVTAPTINIEVGSVTTAGSQSYNGAVLLDHDTTLTSTGYTNAQNPSLDLTPGISFGSTVDGAFNLIADSDGVIDFGGAVGGTTPLASLTSGGSSNPASGVTETNARVNTSGAQTYNHPLEIGSTGSITEGIDLAAGTYLLDFLAAQGANNSAGETLQVSVDGHPAGGSVTPTGSSDSPYGTAAFTVTAGTHTITIAGLNPHGGNNAALVSDISIPPATANQLADPDFGAATIGAGNWQYAPSGSPWTFMGTAGASGNYSAITGGNPTAPQGSQVAFVQGTGSMSQMISLSAGTYTVEFLAAQRGNYNFGGQSLQVSVDGAPLTGSITPAGSNYALYGTAVFTITAGTHTITIAGLNPHGGDNTALVSAVSLQSSTANKLADPDFTATNVGAGIWQYAPSGSPWAFMGTAGASGNYSAITGGNPTAPQGSQVAFVQGTGSMSQLVSLSAGTYTVEFLAAQRGNYNFGGQSLQVSVDGAPLTGSITPAGSNYALYGTAVFTIAAGTHTITITGLNPHGGDNTALVNGVSIQAVVPSQITDPDFSAATVGAGNWQYAPNGSPWAFTGTAGVSGNASAITGGNPTAPQGSQVAFVQGTGSISQTVSLSAGTYMIQFQAAQRGNYNFGGQSLQVSVDGAPLTGSITPAGSNYALYGTAVFTIAAGTHTITITGLNPHGGDNTALVNGVSIQAVVPSQITDPEFSAATVGAGNWQYAPNGSPWAFTGTAGVSGNASAITSGNPAAPQGNQVAFAQGTGSISQAVSLSAGTYMIQFEAAQRGNYNFGGQSIQVSVDGTPLGSSITPSGSSYILYSTAIFTVPVGVHVITIAGLNPLGGDNTALIDDVSINDS